ncbi:DUF1190 domain-containing protein [Rubellimicrobium arenae]|nr:DUF1190 domain-containing protein [Rubellimicrobium arenae]
MAALTLAACEEDPVVQAQAFPDLASCIDEADEADAAFTAQDCETAFLAAQAAHLESAPRYEDEALCEEQHGGECIVEARPGGSVFMPILTGYLLGRALSGGSGLLSQPLVSRPGGFATVSGDTRLSSNAGGAEMRASAFRAAPSTRLAPPMSRATVARTGGFGQTRTAIGGRSVGG